MLHWWLWWILPASFRFPPGTNRELSTVGTAIRALRLRYTAHGLEVRGICETAGSGGRVVVGTSSVKYLLGLAWLLWLRLQCGLRRLPRTHAPGSEHLQRLYRS